MDENITTDELLDWLTTNEDDLSLKPEQEDWGVRTWYVSKKDSGEIVGTAESAKGALLDAFERQ